MAVHQRNGDSGYALGPRLGQRHLNGSFIQRANLASVGVKTARHFGHRLIQKIGAANIKVKKRGSRLRADPQKVGKTFGDQQQNPLTLAFKKGVRGDRGAHFHGVDGRIGQGIVRPKPKAIPDALHSGVRIAAGIFGQKLGGHQTTIRRTPDDIGERAAAVDPELPPHAASSSNGRRLKDRLDKVKGAQGEGITRPPRGLADPSPCWPIDRPTCLRLAAVLATLAQDWTGSGGRP